MKIETRKPLNKIITYLNGIVKKSISVVRTIRLLPSRWLLVVVKPRIGNGGLENRNQKDFIRKYTRPYKS